MAVQYVNRRGQVFYLHEGSTRSGKPKYYFSLKGEGTLAESVPDGFEIYENPNARVVLRRIQPKIITDEEIETVHRAMQQFYRGKHYRLEVKKDIISVFVPDQDLAGLTALFRRFPAAREVDVGAMVESFISYSPMLRFILIDREQRRFKAQRYCYLGSVDDWIDIGPPGTLESLLKAYVKHLGQESYYELY